MGATDSTGTTAELLLFKKKKTACLSLRFYQRDIGNAYNSQNAVNVYKWKTAANQDGWQKEWQHARFGDITDMASSIHPHLLFGQAVFFKAPCCLGVCEILWDRIHSCEGNTEPDFRTCVRQNGPHVLDGGRKTNPRVIRCYFLWGEQLFLKSVCQGNKLWMDLGSSLVRGVHFAHREGFIMREIKPAKRILKWNLIIIW